MADRHVADLIQNALAHANEPGSALKNSLARRVIAGYQRADHLPVDPTRLYAERSLYWVIWYVGVPAVLLGEAVDPPGIA